MIPFPRALSDMRIGPAGVPVLVTANILVHGVV